MTLNQLAKTYEDSSALLKQRCAELRGRLLQENLSETEKLRLRRRIAVLSDMAREAGSLARYLDDYYEGADVYANQSEGNGISGDAALSQTA